MKRKRRHPFFTLLAAAALAAALLTGCGDSDETTTDEAAITKAAFIRQADAVCTKSDKAQERKVAQLGEEVKQGGKAMNDEELILAAGLPPLRQQVEELSELPVPEGDAQAEAVIEGIEEALAAAESDPTSLLGEETSFTEVEAQARAYGFKVCGAP